MVQKHTNFRTILNCATHKGNFRANFFFSDKKKPLAQLAHPYFGLKVLVLANNSVPRALAQLGTNGVFTSFFAIMRWHSLLLGARDPFCFFENFFAQIFPYRVYIGI